MRPGRTPRGAGCVDPLCGTRNFAAGLPLMSSNVALTLDGAVTAGRLGRVRRGGDVLDRRRLRPGPAGTASTRRYGPSAVTLMVAINLEVDAAGRQRASDLLADPAFFETYQPRITSTTLALAWVAAGRHAAYLTEGDLVDNVHFAAGLGLCVAAGCVVTDLAGGPVRTGPSEPAGRRRAAGGGGRCHPRRPPGDAGRVTVWIGTGFALRWTPK